MEQAGQCAEMLRLQLQRAQDVLLRAFVVFAQETDEGALVPRLGIVGSLLDGAVEQGFGGSEIEGLAALHRLIDQLADLRAWREVEPETPDLVFQRAPIRLGGGGGEMLEQPFAQFGLLVRQRLRGLGLACGGNGIRQRRQRCREQDSEDDCPFHEAIITFAARAEMHHWSRIRWCSRKNSG